MDEKQRVEKALPQALIGAALSCYANTSSPGTAWAYILR